MAEMERFELFERRKMREMACPVVLENTGFSRICVNSRNKWEKR